MREWILVLAPIAVVFYFAAHPPQFLAFMNWFARLLH